MRSGLRAKPWVLIGVWVTYAAGCAADGDPPSSGHTTKAPLPPPRGRILASDGSVLAEDRESTDAWLELVELDFVPARLAEGEGALAEYAEVAHLAPDAVRELRVRTLIAAKRGEPRVLLQSELPDEARVRLEAAREALPAIRVVQSARRVRPRRWSREAVGAVEVHDGAVVGSMGVEALMDSVLGRGSTSAAGSSSLRRVLARPEAQHARDVTLTLDPTLTESIQRTFTGVRAGGAIAVEVHTGRILAVYTKRDPAVTHLGSGAPTDAELAWGVAYQPSGVFKPFVALAALREGRVEPSTAVECERVIRWGRQRLRCTHAHELVTLRTAIAQSCNIYQWRMTEGWSAHRLGLGLSEFGFGRETGLGLAETAGSVPSNHASRGDFMNAVIGGGPSTASLLQLALGYAMLANGGTLYEPQLVHHIASPDGETNIEVPPAVAARVDIAPEHLEVMRSGFSAVVNEEMGTAFSARIEGGVMVAGKTGTPWQMGPRPYWGAQDWWLMRDHGAFVGYAPAEDPTVVVAVLVEHGGTGGIAAAPIATRVLQDYLGGP